MTQDVITLLDRGLVNLQAGEWDKALDVFDSVLAKDPSHPDGLWLRGAALLNAGRVQDAVESLEKAHAVRPEDAAICNDFAMALERAGQNDRACQLFDQAVALDPEFAPGHVNRARLLFASGNVNAALEAADAALAIDETLSDAHNMRGTAFRYLNKSAEAMESYEQALVLDPDNTEARLNQGLLLYEQGDHAKAAGLLESVRESARSSETVWADAVMMMGLIAAGDQDLAGAVAQFDAVLQRCPGHVATWVNRGEVKQRQGALADADQEYRQALMLDPDSAEAHFNLAQLLLLQEHWAEGWDEYEWRWRTADFDSKQRDHGLPQWDGTVSTNMTLLIWGEQGIGDQILFASLLKDLANAGVSLVLEVDPRLVPVLGRDTGYGGVYGYDQVPPEVLARCQAQLPQGSLGRVLRRRPEDFGEPSPFICPDDDLVAALKDKYRSNAGDQPIVGLSWQSANPRFGKDKSIALADWMPVLQTNGVRFVSLQYGDVKADVETINAQLNTDILVDDDINPLTDIDSAAAQIAAMDLVVTSSNTTAHLSAALGQDTWVVIPKVPEWRWGLERADSLWYSNVILCRQSEIGDWSDPLAAVARALADRVAQR